MNEIQPLRERLARVSAEGTPSLRAFAPWVLDNLPLVAFSSIRGLAQQAGVNPNTVTRLASVLGYDGFNEFRADVRASLQNVGPIYGDRARALRQGGGRDVLLDLIEASRTNAENLFSEENLALLESCVQPLLKARRIYVVGVRSCYSIAHYLSYVGRMAFPNFVDIPSLPGSILDQVSDASPEDIVVCISYSHYSAEVVRACRVANACGARVLALTDSHSSPIAIGAWKVLRLPMAGPQFMPSLASAFLAAEMLLVAMAAQSEDAADKLTAFEQRIERFGGYSPS